MYSWFNCFTEVYLLNNGGSTIGARQHVVEQNFRKIPRTFCRLCKNVVTCNQECLQASKLGFDVKINLDISNGAYIYARVPEAEPKKNLESGLRPGCLADWMHIMRINYHSAHNTTSTLHVHTPGTVGWITETWHPVVESKCRPIGSKPLQLPHFPVLHLILTFRKFIKYAHVM